VCDKWLGRELCLRTDEQGREKEGIVGEIDILYTGRYNLEYRSILSALWFSLKNK